jgi:predicted phage-related endonuclease
MTRKELKDLIKETLQSEARYRSSQANYNAAIRAAAEKFKEKQAAKDAEKAADADKLAQITSQTPNLSSKVINIKRRISILDGKIKELENQLSGTDIKTPEELLQSIPTLKIKTQLEIDRLEEYMNLQNALQELVAQLTTKP